MQENDSLKSESDGAELESEEKNPVDEVTSLVKAQCLKTEHQHFPNGSDYNEEVLRSSDRFQVEAVYNYKYLITDLKEMKQYTCSYERKSAGPGTDLGMYFNTRDQVLAALQPGGEGLELTTNKWIEKYQKWAVEDHGKYVILDNSGPFTVFRSPDDWSEVKLD